MHNRCARSEASKRRCIGFQEVQGSLPRGEWQELLSHIKSFFCSTIQTSEHEHDWKRSSIGLVWCVSFSKGLCMAKMEAVGGWWTPISRRSCPLRGSPHQTHERHRAVDRFVPGAVSTGTWFLLASYSGLALCVGGSFSPAQGRWQRNESRERGWWISALVSRVLVVGFPQLKSTRTFQNI